MENEMDNKPIQKEQKTIDQSIIFFLAFYNTFAFFAKIHSIYIFGSILGF
jgi:hypothetical protein